MTNEKALSCLTDKCDIYFENSLISKELIVKKYVEFFTSALSSNGHSVSVALHTGSVCFELVSFIMVALASVSFDRTNSETIIDSLNNGDIVLFRNSRYRWRGLDFRDGTEYIALEQDGRGKNGKSTLLVPFQDNKYLVKPYYGTSSLTDGRGIKRQDNKRSDFISYVLGVPVTEVPSITGASVVIVTERDTFARLSKGLRISYGDNMSVGLLDIVTASYYTDSGEEYQLGNNPAKTEPVLKITRKISTARDLVLERHGNTIVGLMVIGADAVSKGGSELIDLLGRKTLKFSHIAVEIDSECAKDIIESQVEAAVFACTREFLLQNSLPPQEINNLTLELDRQIENIVNNTVKTEIADGGCSWEDYRKIKEALYAIKNSEWNDDNKNSFLIKAYSLLNLLITAVFPVEKLEKAIENGMLKASVTSPAIRIRELWDLAENAESVEYHCIYVIDALEQLYESCFADCSKYNALKRYLESSNAEKIAIVVPKAYYVNILCEDEIFYRRGITIVTANRFDNSVCYDEIIAIGDFCGKRFDPVKCRSAENIIVLLYECETHWFKYKKHKAGIFENKLNSRLGVIQDDLFDDVLENNEDKTNDLISFIDEELDLEKYINNISILDINKYTYNVSGYAGDTLTSEVCAIGRFVSDEQVLFSEYYKAVVFDSVSGAVSEIAVENLSVFLKRDGYARNMVDYIYENLQISGRLSPDVLDATKKASYWKEILREYKATYDLSYRDIAIRLQKLGSSLKETSIRQWLIEESHIVGPRDEITLKHIGELTQDSYLLNDTHSYFEACRIVRRQRKEILELIGKAIIDKLRGHKPPTGSILEIVYDNVENLSEILELATFSLLEEPVTVSINLINKPITDWEVTI
jgi:hypothetical protein